MTPRRSRRKIVLFALLGLVLAAGAVAWLQRDQLRVWYYARQLETAPERQASHRGDHGYGGGLDRLAQRPALPLELREPLGCGVGVVGDVGPRREGTAGSAEHHRPGAVVGAGV